MALFEAPTIAGLAKYLQARYPEAVERKFPGMKEDSMAKARVEVG